MEMKKLGRKALALSLTIVLGTSMALVATVVVVVLAVPVAAVVVPPAGCAPSSARE